MAKLIEHVRKVQEGKAPNAAIAKLFDYARPGGMVLFDVYPLKWYTPLMAKYWLRALTVGSKTEKFLSLAEQWVPRLLRTKKDFVNRIFPDNKWGHFLSDQLIPIVDHSRSADFNSWEQKVQWSILDTIDRYTPRYDKPMTFRSVMQVLKNLGAREIQADPVTFCFRATVP